MLLRPLSPELAERATKDLNETPQRVEEGIRHLKEWICKQPHLRARTDDQWLAAFLRGCKHSIERAKAKLDLYYSLRTVSPELFSFGHKEKKFEALLRTQSVLVLPGIVNPRDPRVVLIQPRLYDPQKFASSEILSFMDKFQQIMYMEDDAFVVNGVSTIVDLKGVTLTHILQWTPVQIKKLVIAGQDASPLRLKALHVVNLNPSFDVIVNYAMKLLNENLKKKIHLHVTDKTIAYDNFVDKRILPAEYGGVGVSAQDIVDYWLKKFNEYASWFEEDTKYGTDEAKRLGKPKTAGDMFGLEGSFRKLELD